MNATKNTNKLLAISLIALLSISLLSINAFAEQKQTNVHSLKIQYLAKTSSTSYFVQFKTCVGNEPVNNPSFQITSDIGSKLIKYDKLHLANTCKNYDATVGAKYPESISIKMANGGIKK